MTQRCKNKIKVSFFWAPGRAIPGSACATAIAKAARGRGGFLGRKRQRPKKN